MEVGCTYVGMSPRERIKGIKETETRRLIIREGFPACPFIFAFKRKIYAFTRRVLKPVRFRCTWMRRMLHPRGKEPRVYARRGREALQDFNKEK